MLMVCLQKVDKENIEHYGDFVHKVHAGGGGVEQIELNVALGSLPMKNQLITGAIKVHKIMTEQEIIKYFAAKGEV
ncbi:hypothetical protein [Vibrio sp. EA2]|uniref:hypothetical protein n=1 Tax=Vibrio sp. EA2 TaxID=3079860 RepID=UPI002948DB53|nr:hypothetical protein [Vibrio sp. EA2]MDV6251148.1 hypothetical protein [Vibrio sp. EA2]